MAPRSLRLLLPGVITLVISLSGAATMTNSWAVQVTSGGQQAADALATKYGLINLGQVGNLKHMYHFVMPSMQHSNDLKRSATLFKENNYLTAQLTTEKNVGYVKQQRRRKLFKKQGYDLPKDPLWTNQWSLLNTGQLNSTDVGNDLNVERAWLQGVTGCDSVVAIVDDGVEYTHSDLMTNYISSIQNDFVDRDGDPFPSTVDGVREAHGTHSAGVVGMEKGDGMCGIGIAYNSLITGLRLISEAGATDMDEAEALSWENDVIDIYSNGWGPEDNGTAVAGPGELLQMAMETSIVEGRGGKGNIYVFASGNGGSQDTCAADGYTNSIYTISVGSAASNGEQSDFDEMCSAKMVVTFDSDPYQNKSHVATADVEESCCTNFTATSASTSLVSGVLALLLDSNPDLTWRDVQYLLAYTSNTNNLVDGDWTTNGAGLLVSLKFGFGAIDAEAIVSRGRHWINVPAQLSQSVEPPIDVPPPHDDGECCNLTRIISEGENMTVTFAVDSYIAALEHVVLVFNMHFMEPHHGNYDYDTGQDIFFKWQRRGTVRVDLTSPSGTTSTLLPFRPGDVFPGSYDDWPLMSVHFWGESATGNWTLMVAYGGDIGAIGVEVPRVTFYGTSQVPEAVSRIPTECSSECDPTRGCAASGAEFCDACAELRVSSTLECTSSCPEGLAQRNGYCYYGDTPECYCPPPHSPTDYPSNSHTVSPSHTHTPIPYCSTTVIPTQTSTPSPDSKSSGAALHGRWSHWSVCLATALTLVATLQAKGP